ncbi:MAG: permease [Bifidobacterium catenulatum]
MAPSRRTSSANYLFLVIGTPLVAFLIAASQAFEAHILRVPLVRIGTSVAGLMLQAVPFMLLGAMMSAAVATLVTTSFIERHLPRTTIGGFTVALAAGLCMPVCDCMSVPTFANLLRKKLPVPCAVTFLIAVPIMNPMAIWSTWYAFPNDPWMVFRRVGLGALMALTAGMSFVVCPIGKIPVRPRNDHAANELGCACGCDDYAKCEHRQSLLRHFLRHTHDDFLRMMPILLVGSTIAAIISITFGNSINADIVANHPLGAIAMAMALAFLCSVCSSSDAVIAAGMSGMLPVSALLAFLTFGPVLDVKNAMMLGVECKAGFTLRLVITITMTCILLAFLVHMAFGI